MIRSGAPAEIDDDQPNEADFACVLPHWGCEFRFRPDEAMRRLAARFAAAGADVVAGTHPHVVQPLEKIDATLIAYSLGDFLGSVLARSPWPLRLMMALAIDFAPDRAQGSRVIGHEAHVFFRMRRDGRERIEQIDALPVAERARAERLAMRVLGGDRSVRGTNLASEPLTS
jgi:poly-gamma-glutamate capsule biosynthesis protein CapA/YwtB (metallophosphatase superfamily)